jgi:hypothetical protein
MPVYVMRDGRMVDRDTGEPMVSGPYRPAAPISIRDLAPYLSPVTGEVISGRRAKRADLERHNCVDTAELYDGGLALDGRLRNRKFAEKRGLTHLLKQEPQ